LYEYAFEKIEYANNFNLIETKVKLYAEKGWRLVTIVTIVSMTPPSSHPDLLIFEREINTFGF